MSYSASDNHRHDPTPAPLGRFWDAVVQDRPAAPDDLDPTLAETVRRLHARDDAPGADAAFAARLLTTLEDHMDTMDLEMTRLGNPPRLSPPSATSDRSLAARLRLPIPSRSVPRRPAWPLAQLASAALVVIALAFAFVALGPPRPGGSDEQTAEAPVMIATEASPSPSATDHTLAAVTFPQGALPDEIVGGFNYYTVAPGSEGVWDWTCCTGIRLDYILNGSLTVTGAGPMQVLRGDAAGAWEDVATGTEIVLGGGDALLSRMEDSFASVNAGSGPVDLLDGVVFSGTPLDDPVPYTDGGSEAWQFQNQDLLFDPVAISAAPVTVRLRQSELAAGAILPVPADASVQLALDLDENAVLSTEADFSRRNASSAPFTVYALTVEPVVTTLAAAPRDTPETLLRPVHESAVKPLAVEALWAATLPVTSARAMAPQIAVDPTGRLWAIDGAAGRFLIVAPDGSSVETWGEPGAGAGQFAFRRDDGEVVGGIAFTPDGGFYVADSQNARIQQFAPDRTFVRAWGEPGEGDGQFVEPSGVSVAPDGEVYVIDDRRDDVQVFAPDGAFLRAFGGPGAADGQFDQPIAGAFAADGAYWLADTGNGRLQQFAAAGDHRLTVASRGRLQGVLDQPQAIAADGDGRIYVADRASRRIQVFDRDGAWVITLGDSAVGEAAFGDPIGVATDAAGDVYVLDVAGGKPALKKSRLVAA